MTLATSFKLTLWMTHSALRDIVDMVIKLWQKTKLCWYGATIENATFSSIIWRSIRFQFFFFLPDVRARAWTYQTQWPRLTVHPAPNIESRRYSSFFSSLPDIISRPWNVLTHIRVIACRWIGFFFCSIFGWGGGWNCERETLGRSSGIIGRRTDGYVSHRLLFDSIYEHKTMRISAIPVFSHEQIRFPSQQENKRKKKIWKSFCLFFVKYYSDERSRHVPKLEMKAQQSIHPLLLLFAMQL